MIPTHFTHSALIHIQLYSNQYAAYVGDYTQSSSHSIISFLYYRPRPDYITNISK